MLLRRFTDQELIAELNARDLEVFPKGSAEGTLKVTLSRDLDYFGCIRDIVELEKYEAYLRSRLAEMIGAEMAKGNAIAFDRHEVGGRLEFVATARVRHLKAPAPETTS